MEELSIFTGNANRQLAASICRHLHIPLGDADVFQFSNE
ncbi:MAG TPA: ribose-phosphate pyrophosphokinase-like domain-containing protein, partial [Ktedonobacteraceae bacterium]|nr:ribose-phosphate pyrophosphokinase-like domain-containing protein [Ktedonobacteraceae bacterium]